ncbi:DUF3108 domain-containing protein [Campylobacter sp. VBCF_05 NA6]|uniref:DUF3108 domain-containing protein n=1 Tax=unclassified Campylobacter TaxID=2593542 RepID=UPI0022E9AF3D|nr:MULTISPECIES: DUF3108 domain-containing protein [unclassified Campylobacter]MDA3058013.1 DUF3108 domain-containing protein [Campylobacter sp. VBCF_04 NA7]MDA3059431.1 DUF3108 domain-containing protein [Campylobacter sp. VBCF_05 NA6]
MRILAFLFFFFGAVFGETIEAHYDISYGVFGVVGHADAKLVKTAKTYEITLNARAYGIAGSLSGDRREKFYSKGSVVGEILKPKIYRHEVERKKGKKTINTRQIFTFDYNNKRIREQKFKGENGDLRPSSDKILPYFATNDLLSVFFNFGKIPHKGDMFFLTAAGAKNETGRIDVQIPRGKHAKAIQNALQTSSNPFIVFINQKIFSSKKGELYLSLNRQEIAENVILKDVLFFGDIHAKLTESKF